MTFEWDENKNSENIRKHKVSFEKAQDAFFDVNRVILEDIKHSVSEKCSFFTFFHKIYLLSHRKSPIIYCRYYQSTLYHVLQ